MSEEFKDAFVWIDPTTISPKNNPRGRSNRGFTVERMGQLREDIRINGHKLPLEVRKVDGETLLIAGERRWRSVMSLIEEDVVCFNRITREWDRASVVYAKVHCIVTHCDSEADAITAAALENMLHVPMTEHEVLMLCQLLEDAGMSRKELADKLKLSEAWVSQTFSLLNPERCNPKVLQAMADGVLGRTQALQFLNYDPDKVETILAKSIERWRMDEQAKMEAAVKEREALVEEWEANDDKLREAEAAGDQKAAAAARKALSDAEGKMNESEKNIKKVKGNQKSKTKPKPSMEQIQEAARDAGAGGTAQRHMPMKTLRACADRINEMLAEGGDLINPITGDPVSRREVRIVALVCDCVLARNGLRTPVDALFSDELPEK